VTADAAERRPAPLRQRMGRPPQPRSEQEDVLSEEGWTPGDINAVIVNPFYAIEIHPALAEPHEPMIDEETWITANVKVIDEQGAEAYLRNLLSVLKGNFPTAEGG
jgi:hypothetical protein